MNKKDKVQRLIELVGLIGNQYKAADIVEAEIGLKIPQSTISRSVNGKSSETLIFMLVYILEKGIEARN